MGEENWQCLVAMIASGSRRKVGGGASRDRPAPPRENRPTNRQRRLLPATPRPGVPAAFEGICKNAVEKSPQAVRTSKKAHMQIQPKKGRKGSDNALSNSPTKKPPVAPNNSVSPNKRRTNQTPKRWMLKSKEKTADGVYVEGEHNAAADGNRVDERFGSCEFLSADRN